MKHIPLKYTNAATLSDSEATMLLYGLIGNQISGGYFADELLYHNSVNRKVTVKINSVGGNVMEGYAICEAVQASKAITHVVGIAASMAGIIHQMGSHRLANDYASIMVHPPAGETQEGRDALLEIMRKQLGNILKAKTSIQPDLIEKIMASTDQEEMQYWFVHSSAIPTFKRLKVMDMVKCGLVDQVIVTSVNAKIFAKLESPIGIYEICNTLVAESDKKPTKKMEIDQVKAALGLTGSSDEKVLEVLASMKKTSEEVPTLKAEKIAAELKATEAEAKVKEAETKIQNAAKQSAETLVDVAIKAKKIKPESKDAFVKMATDNFETVKAMFEGMAATAHAAISDTIKEGEAVTDEKVLAEQYINLAKFDPTKLKNIMETNPDYFSKLAAAHGRVHQQ